MDLSDERETTSEADSATPNSLGNFNVLPLISNCHYLFLCASGLLSIPEDDYQLMAGLKCQEMSSPGIIP